MVEKVFDWLIDWLTSKSEALFTSWHFFKMAANESRFDVLYFCQNLQMEKNCININSKNTNKLWCYLK